MLIYAHKAVAVPEAALIGSCRSVCAEEGTFGSRCLSKVGHGCLSVFYMLWIDRLHTSIAHPLHRTRRSHQPMGLWSKNLSTHQEFNTASSNSSMAGSRQGIIIKSMPQLHLACLPARVCVWGFRACLCYCTGCLWMTSTDAMLYSF